MSLLQDDYDYYDSHRMKWICKFCAFSSTNQRIIIRHYGLKHGHFSRYSPLPCIYSDCVCSFKKHLDLKNLLLKQHGQLANGIVSEALTFRVKCDLCDFSEPCRLRQYFIHLRGHLKNKEVVNCPYKQCSFKSNVYSTFTSHQSRFHSSSNFTDFRAGLVCENRPLSLNDEVDSEEAHEVDEPIFPLDIVDDCADDDEDIIQRRLPSLFLRMQTLLHVSKSAIQEIIDVFF